MKLPAPGRISILAGALCAAFWGGTAQADSVASAQSACYILDGIFEGIDRFERKCEVRPAQKTVIAFIALDQAKAGDLCTAMAGQLRDNNVRFDRGWTLRLYSPRQTSAPLATCRL